MNSKDTGTNSSNKQAALVQLIFLGGESKKAWDPFYILVVPGSNSTQCGKTGHSGSLESNENTVRRGEKFP